MRLLQGHTCAEAHAFTATKLSPRKTSLSARHFVRPPGKDCAIKFHPIFVNGFVQDFNILLRFSLRFRRSTRLLCIFSSIFWNRSRSSLAARLVLIASTRRYITVSPELFTTWHKDALVALLLSLPSFPSPWLWSQRASSSLLCAYPMRSDWPGA
jgi:hypothetical protein